MAIHLHAPRRIRDAGISLRGSPRTEREPGACRSAISLAEPRSRAGRLPPHRCAGRLAIRGAVAGELTTRPAHARVDATNQGESARMGFIAIFFLHPLRRDMPVQAVWRGGGVVVGVHAGWGCWSAGGRPTMSRRVLPPPGFLRPFVHADPVPVYSHLSPTANVVAVVIPLSFRVLPFLLLDWHLAAPLLPNRFPSRRHTFPTPLLFLSTRLLPPPPRTQWWRLWSPPAPPAWAPALPPPCGGRRAARRPRRGAPCRRRRRA